ncbi:MAG: hypothetical protein IJ890_03065 [Clostridia bacterium]|nr:hypothetical protein [Clostridia bacterium]
MKDDINKKKRQLNNLENLVENHTRTERHLEQYSEIGSKKNKENAREKQNVREHEINNLESKILGEGESISIEEQINNISENFNRTHRYMEENYEKIPQENWDNLNKKQDNRIEQTENLLDKLDFE